MTDNPSVRYEAWQAIIDDPTSSEADRQAAKVRQAFWQARYPRGAADETPYDAFLAMWYNLILTTTPRRLMLPKRMIRREIEKFFSRPVVLAALTVAGPQAEATMAAELLASASFYLELCKTDKNYTSSFFNLIKSKDNQVAAKAAGDVADGILRPLVAIDHMPWRDTMVRAAHSAYRQVFPDFTATLDERIAQLKPEHVEQIKALL